MKKLRKFLVTLFFSSPILYCYMSSTSFAADVAEAGKSAVESGFFTKVMSLFTAGNFEHILAATGAFAALATLTANKTDNKICNAILRFINYFGMNFGLAKNKDEEVVAPK